VRGAGLRYEAVEIQQVAVLLAARTRSRLHPAGEAQIEEARRLRPAKAEALPDWEGFVASRGMPDGPPTRRMARAQGRPSGPGGRGTQGRGQGHSRACRWLEGPLPPDAAQHTMANETTEPPAMRMGACPYCERTVLVYEEPPRCPICACPLDGSSMRPFHFPSGPVEPATETDGGLPS